MGFAAVARVTDGAWTACAVRDTIGFGLKPGGQLDVHTTLCKEARAARRPVAFDHASEDATYRDHHTPRIYSIESYVSVPIVLSNGDYFGNLCAIDPKPVQVSDATVVASFEAFAQLIATELDRGRREEAVEAELMSERASSVLREQFIAVLGHDLRSPLAAVAASAELLLRQGNAVDVEATGRRIKSSVRRMSRLIDDVLDFARGRVGGGLSLALTTGDGLSAALLAVVSELRVANPAWQIDERIAIPATTCDIGRVQQLLSNLLANAVNHGGDRSEPIRVETAVIEGALEISVSNGGPPIDAEHLSRIFEPYWRPPSSVPGGGLGLGLHICSQIAAAHGGSMVVSSPPGGRTRFTARLPIVA